jgi:tRNA A-37 threonylcarbamoyl transferase component Bud32
MSDRPDSSPEPTASIKEIKGRIGKYDIIRPLGKGAMGIVYLAHDTILERDVALKVMVSQIEDDPELKSRFEREAKAVAKMTHPNVVNVFDLGKHSDGSPFIAMELLKGKDLQKAVRTPPPMSLDRKVSIIVQVLAGLAHAHQAGIVHRDIKPANIFLNDDGAVKIMDFGVARLTTASMTGTGNIVGTADYMSPEQVKGAKVDGRSDLFSVGCMLYELLAGRRPFHAENLMAIFYKITHEEANFAALPKGPDYDDLKPILEKALAKNLEDRYQTAYDFAVALREYLQTHTSSATGQHSVDQLADLGPRPTSPPLPMTDASGPTLVEGDAGGTVDLGSGRTTRPGTGTIRGGATVVGGGTTRMGTAPTVLPGARPSAPVRSASMPRRPAPAPRSSNTLVYVALGLIFVVLVGVVVFVVTQRPEPRQVVVVQAPTTTVAPVTTLPPPPTTAPPPTLGNVEGKASAAIRVADQSFKQGDYDRAVAQAQAALRDDPGNASARRVLENATKGQEAVRHFRAADAALGHGDYTVARNEADAGRGAAPWDGRGTRLIEQIQDAERAKEQARQAAAQQAAQQQTQQKTAQLNDLVGKADQALLDQKFDVAIAFYDQALALDPQSQRALNGKSTAVQSRARSLSDNGPRTPAGRTFVAGKTQAQSIETASSGGIPGFEESAGVTVKKGTQAADLPGKISIDVDPQSPKPGDKYTVKVTLLNEGNAPIQVKDLLVSTTVNGKRSSGPVPALVKEVAPHDRAVVREFPDQWKEETTSWVMEVTVRTVRGETYKNQVTWR